MESSNAEVTLPENMRAACRNFHIITSMDILPQPKTSSVASSVAAVRQAWLDAIRAADVERLAALVTDDVVVVHGNGRCVRGREELKADMLRAFAACSIEQKVYDAEVVIRGGWAFEIAEVETRLTPHHEGDVTHVHSTTVVALHKESDGSWKVGRVIGLVHP